MLNLHVVEDAVWYPPDIADNRQKKPADQFALLVDPMSGQELAKDLSVYIKDITSDESDEGTSSDKYQAMRNGILVRHVKQIRNCFFSVVKDGSVEKQEVKTIDELIDVCTRSNNDDILQTIYAEIKSHSTLAETMLGNSGLRFDSATRETSGTSAGDAPSVKARALPTKIISETPGAAPVSQEMESPSSGPPN